MMKIEKGREDKFHTTEKKALRDLQIKSVFKDVEDEESHSIVERTHKRLMISNVSK